jgi:hypothetical protein
VRKARLPRAARRWQCSPSRRVAPPEAETLARGAIAVFEQQAAPDNEGNLACPLWRWALLALGRQGLAQGQVERAQMLVRNPQHVLARLPVLIAAARIRGATDVPRGAAAAGRRSRRRRCARQFRVTNWMRAGQPPKSRAVARSRRPATLSAALRKDARRARVRSIREMTPSGPRRLSGGIDTGQPWDSSTKPWGQTKVFWFAAIDRRPSAMRLDFSCAPRWAREPPGRRGLKVQPW